MVTYIIRLQQLKFYHRYINGNLLEYFSRLGIRDNEDNDTHYTRNRHVIHSLIAKSFFDIHIPIIAKKAGILYLHIVSIDKEQSCNFVKRDSRDI